MVSLVEKEARRLNLELKNSLEDHMRSESQRVKSTAEEIEKYQGKINTKLVTIPTLISEIEQKFHKKLQELTEEERALSSKNLQKCCNEILQNVENVKCILKDYETSCTLKGKFSRLDSNTSILQTSLEQKLEEIRKELNDQKSSIIEVKNCLELNQKDKSNLQNNIENFLEISKTKLGKNFNETLKKIESLESQMNRTKEEYEALETKIQNIESSSERKLSDYTIDLKRIIESQSVSISTKLEFLSKENAKENSKIINDISKLKATTHEEKIIRLIKESELVYNKKLNDHYSE